MKKLFLIIIGLCLCTALYADMNTYIIGSGVEAGGDSTITVIGTSSDQSNGTEAFTLPMPTNTVEGHMMVAIIGEDNATERTWTCTGWTQMQSSWAGGTGLVSFYKEAGADEAGPYDFDVAVADSAYCDGVIITLSKSGGTWDMDQDYATSNIANTAAEITTGSVNCTDNSILIVAFGNDGGKTVSVAPSDVTIIGEVETTSSSAIAGYYELRDSGAVTKTLTWSANDESVSQAIVIDLVP